MGITLTSFDGHQRIDTHTGQVGQRLLVYAKTFSTFFDQYAYSLLIHFTLYCDFAAKLRKKVYFSKKNHNKM